MVVALEVLWTKVVLKTVDGKGYGAVMTDDESTSFAGLVGVHNMVSYMYDPNIPTTSFSLDF